jgi:hypothetical protein
LQLIRHLVVVEIALPFIFPMIPCMPNSENKRAFANSGNGFKLELRRLDVGSLAHPITTLILREGVT